jgi:DNA gyrase subunit A
VGRVSQGVKLVSLDDNDVVSAVARVIPDDKEDGESAEVEAKDAPDAGEMAAEPAEGGDLFTGDGQ